MLVWLSPMLGHCSLSYLINLHITISQRYLAPYPVHVQGPSASYWGDQYKGAISWGQTRGGGSLLACSVSYWSQWGLYPPASGLGTVSYSKNSCWGMGQSKANGGLNTSHSPCDECRLPKVSVCTFPKASVHRVRVWHCWQTPRWPSQQVEGPRSGQG